MTKKFIEYKLGDYTEICTGTKNNNDKKTNGRYFFYVRSDKIEKIDTYSFDGEAILIPGEGNIGQIIHYIKGKFDYHQRVYKISNFRDLSAKYVYYYMSNFFGNYALSKSVKATVESLRRDTFLNFTIKAPEDIEEQKAIAEVLSDIDNLIEATEKLIEKKKLIKKGAMQKFFPKSNNIKSNSLETFCYLITKQTGFDYSEFIKPNLLDKPTNNSLPMVQTKNFSGRNFNWKTDYYVPKQIAKLFPSICINSPCLLLSIVGSLGNIGLYLSSREIFLGGAICIARFHDEICIPFIYYYLCSEAGQTQIKNITKGAGQATITIEDIRKIKIPKILKEESLTISRILSDMDNEIEILENKLIKYNDIKLGMMYQLLTGSIRLPLFKQTDIKLKMLSSHSKEFNDAIAISAIVDFWGRNPKYPLGRVKIHKLLYLYERKQNANISGFLEKAAGPYDKNIRYIGGERIAKRNKYIVETKGSKGSIFTCGEKINDIRKYIDDWNIQPDIDWLIETFGRTSREELEVLATIDNARIKLEDQNVDVNLKSIKSYIQSSPEWKAKLKLNYFNDISIQKAIEKSYALFG